MIIKFDPTTHSYINLDSAENIKWISATTFISFFKPSFNAEEQAIKSSKNKKSKWYGLEPRVIKDLWTKESNRATTLGTWYHNEREKLLCELQSIQRDGTYLPIYSPIYKEHIKISPSQKLDPGIYPEHMVYLKSVGLCGQSDYVEVVNGKVNIIDYKTNKEIKLKGFQNWEGIVQKMKSPISHLDDCNYIHYALQLSLYMFIILKHNPKLKPGSLTIHHVIFEEDGRDQFDYPITKLDDQGNPIVKEIIPYELPYLKEEIISLIHYLQDNRDKIQSYVKS